MKKLLVPFVLAAFPFLSQNVGAQTHYDANISVGVKAGTEFSRVFFNPSVNQKLPFGATAGVTFRYIEENHFGLIAELDFTQRGWEEDFQGAPYRYRRTLNYIQIPVLAHIYFGRRGRFFINAGPEIGFMISESTSANFNVEEMSQLPGFPLRNRTNEQMTMPVKNKVDYGISGGLGGEFNITHNHSVSLEGRFYFGLGNIFSSRRTDIFSSSNSMAVSLTANYWFRVK